MKLTLAAALALVAAGQAFGQTTGSMGDMPGMSAAPTKNSSMAIADGVGTVTAVDAKAGMVTIHHRPIAKLNWPAMTMNFKASSPSVLNGVKPGQSVKFQIMMMGGVPQVTSIQPS